MLLIWRWDTLIGSEYVSSPKISTENAEPETFLSSCEVQHEEAAAKAVQFFKETHGLDLSSFRDEETRHENASMLFFQSPLKLFAFFNSVGKIDQEISVTKCYPVTIGGHRVKFHGEQTLHGNSVKPGDILGFQYYRIETGSSGKPLVFHFRTNIPVRYEPTDGHTIANMEVFHDQLGSGQVHGVFCYVEKDGNTHITVRVVITFPLH